MILEKPKSTEKIMRMIEINNTIVFETDRKCSKPEIKQEVEDVFGVKVESVNTHTRKNKKIAYVKLKSGFPAIDIATKLGLM